jgi:cation transport ATPase
MKLHEQREPPKFAIKLLRLICHPDFKEEIEGDVLERYNGDLRKYGYKVARKNIWWQVFLLTKPNLIFNLTRNNMKNIFNPKENPQGMLAIAALVLLLLITTTVVLDFDFADKTMFTVPMSAIVWFIPVLLLLFWIVYITTSKLLYSKVLTRIHVLTTVGVTLAIVVTAFIAARPHQSAINNYELMGTITQILVLTFVLIQIAYISNLVIGLLSRFGKSAKQTK